MLARRARKTWRVRCQFCPLWFILLLRLFCNPRRLQHIASPGRRGIYNGAEIGDLQSHRSLASRKTPYSQNHRDVLWDEKTCISLSRTRLIVSVVRFHIFRRIETDENDFLVEWAIGTGSRSKIDFTPAVQPFSGDERFFKLDNHKKGNEEKNVIINKKCISSMMNFLRIVIDDPPMPHRFCSGLCVYSALISPRKLADTGELHAGRITAG